MRHFNAILIFVLFSFVSSFEIADEIKISKRFPKSWTQLSKTQNGFVVYDPCDGSTPTIKLNNFFLSINGQHESKEHSIEKFTRLSDSSYHITCDNSELSIVVKWLDRSKSKALWTIKLNNSLSTHIYKMVMCPTILSHKFRFIDNPCSTEKIGEEEFLSVENH